MDKRVFVIIVTYNGARWIDKNLSSLLSSAYPVSIIAVDNNSSDDSVALLEKYPAADIIKSDTNLGFGKANNLGVQKALAQGADYIFLLNQDTWIFKDTIGSLVEKMEELPQLGLLSPVHYSGDGISLDTSFATYMGRITGDIEGKGVALVPFVNAAAWMLSRACVERTGMFEPLFGHYGEDRNYCDRVHYHGFGIGIDKDSKICHDRIITRSFTKDVIQSKYKVLAALLDIHNSTFWAYMQGLREVFGLPKYFMKFYGFGKALSLFFKLLGYYIQMVFAMGRITAARKNAM